MVYENIVSTKVSLQDADKWKCMGNSNLKHQIGLHVHVCCACLFSNISFPRRGRFKVSTFIVLQSVRDREHSYHIMKHDTS